MSGQAGPSGEASGSADLKPPNNSSTKQRKAKRSGKKKRNPKKNYKPVNLTTTKPPEQMDDPELVEVTKPPEDWENWEDDLTSEPKTTEQVDETGGTPEQVFVESVVDPTLAENAAAFQPKMPDQDAETGGTSEQVDGEAVDFTPAENFTNFEKETTEQDAETGGTLEPAGISKQADGPNDPIPEVAQSEPDEFGEHKEKETKPADNTTDVKQRKTRIRKKKNRKHKPTAIPVPVESRPVPPPSTPEPITSAPRTLALSYSAVVKPFEERQRTETATVPAKLEYGPPGVRFDSISDEEDAYGAYPYEDEDDDESYRNCYDPDNYVQEDFF